MHHEDHHWKIIRDGIRAVGILNMEIYLSDNKLFMIVDAPLDFEWHLAFEKLKKCPFKRNGRKKCLFIKIPVVGAVWKNGS